MKFANSYGVPVGSNNRIEFLDGFRAVAILAVIGFHYYSRFADEDRLIYPYGSVWAHFPLFEHGHYGVQLFFAVSGFVISATLTRCSGLGEFVVRRFARLWPTMLICCTISYCFLTFFPRFWPQDVQNFLPSLTFIPGYIFERIIPGVSISYIDGVYWTLFVEVRFYLMTALVYFYKPQSFLQNFIIVSLCAFFGAVIAELSGVKSANLAVDLLFIPAYLPWFLIGVGAFCLLGRRHWWAVAYVGLSIIGIVLESSGDSKDMVVAVIVIVLFAGCFYSDRVRRAFSPTWLTSVGVASYSLYLLHQCIGVTATSMIASLFSLPPHVSLLLPIGVAAILIYASRIIYWRWESPLNKIIVRRYLRNQIAVKIGAQT